MNLKQNWPVLSFVTLSLVVLAGVTAVYVAHFGESNPIETETNLLTSVYALVATWMALSVWTLLRGNDSQRGEWAFLSVGIGLWTMAELLWTFLAYMLQETPYPSVADAFWVPGYAMVVVFAFMRYRALRVRWNSKKTQVLLAVFAAFFVLVVIFVILPMLLPGQFDAPLTLLLNIFYPVADLLVLFSALLMALSFAGGRFSAPWAVLAVGLATLSLSDILFIYADWNGLYMAEGNLTPLTAIVDIGNLSAYVLLALGMLLHQRLLSGNLTRELAVSSAIRKAPQRQNAMVFIDSSDRVVFANHNLPQLFWNKQSNLVGKPLGEVLQLSPADAQSIFHELHRSRKGSMEKYIALYPKNGNLMSGWLRIQANFNDLREYTGADITCEMEWQSNSDLEAKASAQTVYAPYTLVFPSREEKLLLDYFSQRVCFLYQTIAQMGGATVVEAFKTLFRSVTQKENCIFSLQDDSMVVEAIPPQPTAYRTMLVALTNYARDMLSVDVVTALTRRVDEMTEKDVLVVAEKFGLRS
ncbi:MAG: hypothetical protein DDG60_01060 [Anaerolineae bacterium]|nr:MAG: hypothetical protein DDG60_01060 [Anaerolineae bacterium]